jgi:hypothetical protein
MEPKPVSEDVLRQTAGILGENSAAAQALRDAELRRERGQQVDFFTVGRNILVRGNPIGAADDSTMQPSSPKP